MHLDNDPTHTHTNKQQTTNRQKPQSNEARLGLLAFRTVNSTTPVTLSYWCGGEKQGEKQTKCFQVRLVVFGELGEGTRGWGTTGGGTVVGEPY